LILLLFFLAAVCVLVAQHPFVTYPLSLVLWNRVQPVPLIPVAADTWPTLSVLCCCYNEEGVIADKIENGFEAASRYPGKVEFLYFSDGSNDRTAEIFLSYGERIKPVIAAERAGKSVGIRELSSRASGDILVFTDANTFIAADSLVELAKVFQDDKVGGASGRLLYTNPDASDTANVNSVYWKLEETIKTLESVTGSTMGADGAFFAIRKQLHRPCPPDIIDDMHTSLNVVLEKWRFISAPSVRTFEKTPTSSMDEFQRKIRIACRAFNCYRLLSPRINAAGGEIVYKFYSHKVARWLSLCFIVLGGAFGIAALVLSGRPLVAAAVVGVLLVCALLGAMGIRPFSRLNEIVLSLVAVSLGVVESLRGKRYQTWKIARSGR